MPLASKRTWHKSVVHVLVLATTLGLRIRQGGVTALNAGDAMIEYATTMVGVNPGMLFNRGILGIVMATN